MIVSNSNDAKKSESPNTAPTASPLSLATKSVEIDLAASDAEGDDLTYTRTNPSNGTLAGSPPNLVYTPQAAFYGTDSFTYFANDGALNSDPQTVTISVTRRTIYLRTSGDTNGVEASPLGLVSTAQEAMDAAVDAGATANDPVLIDVGVSAGNFGPITLRGYISYGDHIHWVGMGPSASIIGDIYANGADINGQTYDEYGYGLNASSVTLNSDGSLSFGSIYASGGAADSGGGHYKMGGAAGNVTLNGQTIAGSIVANGGESHFDMGARGGTIVVAGAVGSIQANGSSGKNNPGGVGGSVTVTGTAGSISANGGSGITGGAGGQGGTISVSGSAGDLSANGGSGSDNPAGAGGIISVTGTAGNVSANGGFGNYTDGGVGGSILVSGVAGDLSSNGGSAESVSYSAGSGGTIAVSGTAGHAVANGGDNVDPSSSGGDGGTITVNNGGIILSGTANGGYPDGNPGTVPSP